MSSADPRMRPGMPGESRSTAGSSAFAKTIASRPRWPRTAPPARTAETTTTRPT